MVPQHGKLNPIYNAPFDLVVEGGVHLNWLPAKDYLQTSHGLLIPYLTGIELQEP